MKFTEAQLESAIIEPGEPEVRMMNDKLGNSLEVEICME